MKKLLLILPLILFTTLPSFAYDFKVDNIYYNILSLEDQTCAVTSGGYSGYIVIPSTVTYNGITYSVTTIGKSAFYDCERLTSITLPNSLTTIGDKAFGNCSSLTSVTLPNSVTTIGDSAFKECTSLTSITLPNSVTTIGNSAFSYCYCESLTSITLPNSVTTIGNSAFSWCSSLTSITLPNSVTTIGDKAFCGCSSLSSINIPNSVTTIGDSAFYSCKSLTSITLPNSLTTIGDYAFNYCSNLTEIISLAVTPPSVKSKTFYNVPTSTCTLKVPAESVAAYKAAKYWKEFRNIIPLTEEELQALPVESISATPTLTAPTYNLRGQQVGTTHKGIVIQNRHKVILK